MLEKKIIDLLKNRAQSGTVAEEVFATIASYLAEKIKNLESALRNGDMTFTKHCKQMHNNYIAGLDKDIEHANALLQSPWLQEDALHMGNMTFKKHCDLGDWKMSDEDLDEIFAAANEAIKHTTVSRIALRTELQAFVATMTMCKALRDDGQSQSRTGLPKVARTELCNGIIVAWQIIKNTDEIPQRTLNNNREPAGEFLDFIRGLLKIAGGYVANVNADELHKSVLLIEKEAARVDDEANNPPLLRINLKTGEVTESHLGQAPPDTGGK